MTTQPETMTAAQTAVDTASTDLEAKRTALATAEAQVKAAQQAQSTAMQDAATVRAGLQDQLDQATAIMAPARLQQAAQDQSTALAAFKTNVTTDPVFGELVTWLLARWRAKHWDQASANATAKLNPEMARQAQSTFTIPQITGTDVADLLADAINSAAKTGMDKINAGIGAQQAAFIDGTSIVASPPLDAASLA